MKQCKNLIGKILKENDIQNWIEESLNQKLEIWKTKKVNNKCEKWMNW